MNITPELQVERKQDSNQVEFAAIPALKGARIKCKAGVRSVRGGKRDLYPVLLQDGVFYIPPILADSLAAVYTMFFALS